MSTKAFKISQDEVIRAWEAVRDKSIKGDPLSVALVNRFKGRQQTITEKITAIIQGSPS